MGASELVIMRDDLHVAIADEIDRARVDVIALGSVGTTVSVSLSQQEAWDLARTLARVASSLVVALVAGVLLFGCASPAEACGRCGLFGRACKFAAHHVPVAVVTPVVAAAPEVFVVNNVYPPANGGAALLAQQGGTVYGLQAAALQYRVDPAETLRQAAELARGAQKLAETGLNGYQTSASLALQLQANADDTLAKGVAASAVLSAAGLNPAQQQTAPQSLRITRGADGKWGVEQLGPGEVAAQLEVRASGKPLQQQASGSLVDRHCGRCHGAEETQPDGGLYVYAGAALSESQRNKAVQAVVSGEMPRGQQLASDVRLDVIRELLTLTDSD